jgi:4'-phosphopantetheinyl transferase
MFINLTEMSCRWAFNVSGWEPTEEELVRISSRIQPDERARIAKLYFKKDAKASTVGRLMIRSLISSKTSTPNHSIMMSRDKNNKPILVYPVESAVNADGTNFDKDDDDNDEVVPPPTTISSQETYKSYSTEARLRLNEALKVLNFNVSHQGDYVVLASDPSASQLGIDIMNVSEPRRIGSNLDDYFRMMNKQFSDGEWVQIRTYYDAPLSEKKQMSNFIRFWCLKEAYVKAIGVGIVIDLRRIEFTTESDLRMGNITRDTKVKVDGEWRGEWKFEERYLDSKHIVAVAKEVRDYEEGRVGGLAAGKGDNNGNEEEASANVPEFKFVDLEFIMGKMVDVTEVDGDWVENFMGKK